MIPACAADSYSLGPEGDRLLLCPAACAAFQADAEARLEVRYDCRLTGP